MKTIRKETAKRLKNGSYSTLMEVFEEAIDTYNEDKFDNGYNSALANLGVHSQRLAEYIAKNVNEPYKPKDIKVDELAKVIEDYFYKALNE